VQFALPVNSGN